MKVKGILIVFSFVITFAGFFTGVSRTVFGITVSTPTATEARGGLIGSGVDELRCPANLSGIGPTWKAITIGRSSIEDLAKYFVLEKILVTPYPPYAGDFALNYEFRKSEFGTLYACVVNNKVAALLLNRQAVTNSSFPLDLTHWVSFLGEPVLVSWHQQTNLRILHWPQYGISVTVYLYEGLSNAADTEWVYLYPFRDENYEALWPINSVWKVQPFVVEMPDVKLDVFDFDAIEMTASASPPWPTATPHASETAFPGAADRDEHMPAPKFYSVSSSGVSQ